MSLKFTSAYKSIGEVVKILNNAEPQKIKINAHTIRFWETQFYQIKPKIFNSKRTSNIKSPNSSSKSSS